MLGIGCPDRHVLPHITSPKTRRLLHPLPPARAGSFFGAQRPYDGAISKAAQRRKQPFLRPQPNSQISAEKFVEKRIDFAILVIDRDPMRRSGELFEPISHASGS